MRAVQPPTISLSAGIAATRLARSSTSMAAGVLNATEPGCQTDFFASINQVFAEKTPNQNMKLTPEEIRKRAKQILEVPWRAEAEAHILKLIEDATGEKLPEPFDESKVVHGSAWVIFGFEFVLIGDRDAMSMCFRDGSLDGPYSRASLIKKLSADRAYHLLGAYDFSAGLPKGGAK